MSAPIATPSITVGLILCTVRRLPQADRYLREGRWLDSPFPLTTTLRGKRVIEQADLVIYADSLVHPGIGTFARPGASVIGSSSLSQFSSLSKGAASGSRSIRVPASEA